MALGGDADRREAGVSPVLKAEGTWEPIAAASLEWYKEEPK